MMRLRIVPWRRRRGLRRHDGAASPGVIYGRAELRYGRNEQLDVSPRRSSSRSREIAAMRLTTAVVNDTHGVDEPGWPW
jgi:hypothetical protein